MNVIPYPTECEKGSLTRLGNLYFRVAQARGERVPNHTHPRQHALERKEERRNKQAKKVNAKGRAQQKYRLPNVIK